MASDCDIWTGAKSGNYGVVVWRVDGKRTHFGVHRLVWMQDHGPIPEGMLVCHTCDTPSCIEKSHLFLGSPLDNMRDKMEKGRCGQQAKQFCPQGHPYDGENLYVHNGSRHCKTCVAERRDAYRARQREVA
jgi:hypothetical protein